MSRGDAAQPTRRTTLSRDRVLRAAVALADDAGMESVSMRRLAQELGVVPMALYKHVANKDELIGGMIEVVVAEIDPPDAAASWKGSVRQRILSARQALLRHPWAAHTMESRTTPTPVVLAYMDSMIGMFRDGGFSVDLTHHVMHALGSQMFGFTQELFNELAGTGTTDPEAHAAALHQMADTYPHIVEIASAADHDDTSLVGPGCDDQFEFEFALDLLLDGFDRLKRQKWSSVAQP